jgi:hypothetical protein
MFFPCLLLKAITMRLELFLSRRSNLEIPKRAYLVGTILTYLCTTRCCLMPESACSKSLYSLFVVITVEP